jgi:hypothetical protein
MKLLGQIEIFVLKNVPLPDLVRICRFYADPKFNMAARANVILLAEILELFSMN